MTAKEYEHHDASAPEPVAYFDPQKREFYWARPTQIDAPTTVDVPPLHLYAAPPIAAPSEDIKALRRENERLLEALAWAYNLRHLRCHSDPVVIPERFAPFIEAALRREDKT